MPSGGPTDRRSEYRRDAAERCRGARRNRGHSVIRQRDAIRAAARCAARIEPARQLETIFQAKVDPAGKGARVFLAPKRLVAERRVGQEHQVPVDLLDQRVDFSGRQPARIRAANQPAHARAGDVVDRNSVLLEPSQEPNVSNAPCGAAAKRQPDGGTRLGRRLNRVGTSVAPRRSRRRAE